jgi:hypothetical protein
MYVHIYILIKTAVKVLIANLWQLASEMPVSVSECMVRMSFFTFEILNRKLIVYAGSASVWTVGSKALLNYCI